MDPMIFGGVKIMSNHSGSSVLDEIVHGLVDKVLLNQMSAAQKKSLCRVLWRNGIKCNCNSSEILDAELARLLKTCARCGDECEEVSADDGICAACKGSG